MASVTPTVICPAAEHHRPLAGTKLYCLVTEAHVREQLAQSRYSHESGTAGSRTRSRVQRPNHYTTTPHVYYWMPLLYGNMSSSRYDYTDRLAAKVVILRKLR